MADSPDTDPQTDDLPAANALSVTELNERIASVVEETSALHGVRCIGEVTNCSQSKAALYFTLTDGESELPCMI